MEVSKIDELKSNNLSFVDEYLLATKKNVSISKNEQASNNCTVDAALIESRTQDLPKVTRLINRDYRSAVRTEVNLIC